MIILSHRGYWINSTEKNTVAAFKRSFNLGFGTETDIRDFNGSLVISHDVPMANKEYIKVEDFFDIYKSYDINVPLALNIKSDGLQKDLLKLIINYNITNYFVFDMSVPDGLLYLKEEMNVFTRHSEYEPNPSFYEEANGVWLDEFNHHWINKTIVAEHLNSKKSVCIVSPELHKRQYHIEWSKYKSIDKQMGSDKLMICTDVPEEARSFFS